MGVDPPQNIEIDKKLTFWASKGFPSPLSVLFFGLKLALGPPKSARIEKTKKYDFFRVNSGRRHFFDFIEFWSCGLPRVVFEAKIVLPS